jgi:hypothetical protein
MVKTRGEILRFQMELLVSDFPNQTELRDCKEMVHKHDFLTLKNMPVYIPTEQKLAFPSPAIPITSGKMQVLFSMYGHLQPLKN